MVLLSTNSKHTITCCQDVCCHLVLSALQLLVIYHQDKTDNTSLLFPSPISFIVTWTLLLKMSNNFNPILCIILSLLHVHISIVQAIEKYHAVQSPNTWWNETVAKTSIPSESLSACALLSTKDSRVAFRFASQQCEMTNTTVLKAGHHTGDTVEVFTTTENVLEGMLSKGVSVIVP